MQFGNHWSRQRKCKIDNQKAINNKQNRVHDWKTQDLKMQKKHVLGIIIKNNY